MDSSEKKTTITGARALVDALLKQQNFAATRLTSLRSASA